MRSNIEKSIFEAKTDTIMSVLAKMKIDVDQYKQKENPNEKYIKKSEAIINALLEYITQTVPEQIENLETQAKQNYTTGYKKGCEETTKIYVWQPEPLDKENFRTQRILELKKEMPHLFDSQQNEQQKYVANNTTHEITNWYNKLKNKNA